MKKLQLIYLIPFFCLFDTSNGKQVPDHREQPNAHHSAVAHSGVTTLVGAFSGHQLQVKITTDAIDNGSPSHPSESAADMGCTNSRFPCSVVKRIEMTIDGKSIYVPRSVYCGLSDLKDAKIESKQQAGILALYGGDASESFVVTVELTTQGIKRKIMRSAEAVQPQEEITYH